MHDTRQPSHGTLDRLVPAVYDELRGIRDRTHFAALASVVMRHVLLRRAHSA